MKIEFLVKRAIEGDKVALKGIIESIQDDVYYLALRMLANPEDAQDAAQEILIKVITNLSSFEFKSKFKTWVYRIAANYLISNKKIKDKEPTFDSSKADLESDLEEPAELISCPEYSAMLNELRIFCTISMLMCFSPSYRMVYILGDIFELEHQEASQILGLSKDTYRKQLSRARIKLIKFMSSTCGLANEHASCSCEWKLKGAICRERVNPKYIKFSDITNPTYSEIQQRAKETQKELKTVTLQRSITHYKYPSKLSELLEVLINQ
ncbi:MAG: RNA polymerase sigma factor [Gammaproteobacteria bacterium]|nr:RNA polymerase sigma factor [Gammaproteobacteria bacterium]